MSRSPTRVLQANPDVGLRLPCNVTVQEEDGHIAVTVVDPVQRLGVLRGDLAVSAAAEVRVKLEKVVSSLR